LWRMDACKAEKEYAPGKRNDGRRYQDEHTGPIMSWEDFEKFEWPDIDSPQATASLEWWQENLRA
jgi:hypothetical protein